MKVKRCPQFCHDSKCPTCTGTGYIKEDGTPATPEEMLEQLTYRMQPSVPRFEERVDNERAQMEGQSEDYYPEAGAVIWLAAALLLVVLFVLVDDFDQRAKVRDLEDEARMNVREDQTDWDFPTYRTNQGRSLPSPPMSTREGLLDEVYTLRNQNEELQRLLAMAELRIEELEASLDTATETKEPPYA